MSSLFGSEYKEAITVDFVNYKVIETNDEVAAVAETLLDEKVLGVDTENTGLDPHIHKPLLLQVGNSEICYIFPTYKGLNLKPLSSILENSKILKVLFNASYDWKWIYGHYSMAMENVFCCQIAERILTNGKMGEPRRHSLANVVRKYLGLELKKEVRSSFVNRDPVGYPITEAELKYAATDVVLLPNIYQRQLQALEQDELVNVAQLEFDVIAPNCVMEYEGVLIDKDKWRENLKESELRKDLAGKKVLEYLDKVTAKRKLFNIPSFNLSSNSQLLSKIKKLGYELPNTKAETVNDYKDCHPVFRELLEYRGQEKVISTYGEKFLSRISKKTNRLHCKFNQVHADSGRFSSSNPNLQNIPGFNPDDEFSLDFRSCFVAKPGYKLITADYSQQELRIIADLSGDPTFYKVYTEVDNDGNKLDVHTSTASQVFSVPYEKVDKAQRKKAKMVNFLMSYGGTEYTLAKRLDIAVEEAKQIIDSYYNKYSKIKSFMDYNANFTLNNGYSLTVSGRRRYVDLPDPNSRSFDKDKERVKRIGKNTPIQGGGADVTKQGMVFIHRAIKESGYDAKIIMVIHDEFVVEVREDQAEAVASLVEREMIRGFTHFFKTVPMTVDAHISNAWEK